MRYLDFKLVEAKFRLYELTDKVKNQMKQKFKNENPNLDDKIIDDYLNKWDQYSSSLNQWHQYVSAIEPNYRDITKLNFASLVELIKDAEAKSEVKGNKKSLKYNQQDDLLYDNNNLVILKGDLREKCIQYGQGYKWCISRTDAQNMFYTYRMRMNEPMFYFVFDKDRPKSDVWHAVVIYVDNQGIYHVADVDNLGDQKMTWEQITQKQPKLRGLEKIFVHQPLTKDERDDYNRYGKSVSLEQYNSYRFYEKYKYIKFGNALSDEQQRVTPDELIAVYAKGMPAHITRNTWDRLKNGDKKYIVRMFDEQIKDWHIVYSFIKNVGIEPIKEKVKENPEWAYSYARDVLKKRWPEAEPAISKNPGLAYSYAREVIRGRWPEAEPAISKDTEWAYEYALGVIRGRWPEGEPAISKYPQWAYRYAHDVLKKRWPEGEPAISKDPRWAYEYARDVLKKRWPEAEPAISKDPKWASYYATDVIRGRWPEAEPAISKDPKSAYNYAEEIIGGRWPEAEPAISKDPKWASYYAQLVIRGRWPEAEPAISKDPDQEYWYQRFLDSLG